MLAESIGVMDALSWYTNLLGFLAGTGLAPQDVPYVKALLRDVREYMREKSYREKPAGWMGPGSVPFNVPDPEDTIDAKAGRDTVDAMR
ncbi:hypothetical protein BCR34DRAFT_575978 [Clohesyomyces aquaticus]|uniref:1,3-beta-glucanosyltransferase n=1 Tax=Clohesyomyces aquaticus TaxID=1231657 RepID=A0A1Y1YRQ7_9PLEO|nr:hypothetical protein BCR34DRAFT_575978 [Clohesyomyces aquaticus]